MEAGAPKDIERGELHGHIGSRDERGVGGGVPLGVIGQPPASAPPAGFAAPPFSAPPGGPPFPAPPVQGTPVYMAPPAPVNPMPGVFVIQGVPPHDHVWGPPVPDIIAWLVCILFFPFGVIALLLCTHRRCQVCGAVFNGFL